MNSERKVVLSLVALVLIVSVLIGPLVLAESEKEYTMTKPGYKVGDYWGYEITDGGNSYEQRNEVKEVSGKITIGYSAEFNSGPGTVEIEGALELEMGDLAIMKDMYEMTSGGNTSMYSYTYNPSLKMYQWPIEKGDDRTVSTMVEEHTKVNGIENNESTTRSFKIQVDNIESVNVKAGEYHAFKITLQDGGYKKDIWYSAEVGNIIKEEDSKGRKLELKSFKCDDPGKIEEKEGDGGGGEFVDLNNSMCLIMPIVGGVVIGTVFGTVYGIYSGYSSDIPRPKGWKRRGRGPKGEIRSAAGPKFCPKHGLRTELKEGVAWCEECFGSPSMLFKYCPHHGAKLKESGSGMVCEDCGGDMKW